MRNSKSSKGFSLTELMIALALGLALTFVMVKMLSGVKMSFKVLDGLSRVQEDGRLAMGMMAEEVRKAGFRKPVWNNPRNGYTPVTAGSVNGASGADDTLQFMYMDDTDCLGVANTNLDPETGELRADYKRLTFFVDGNDVLTWSCEFGTNPQNLTAQINNQAIVDGVESFQVLYGIDTDFPPDMSINSWSTADGLTMATSVCIQSQYLCETGGLLNAMLTGVPVAVKLGMLVASPDTTDSDEQAYNVLDVQVPAADDQRMRKVYVTTVTLRNLTI